MNRGADRSFHHNSPHRTGRSDSAISSGICGRCDDLCCCGRTDPGITVGKAYEYRYDRSGIRICDDDGTGCSSWVDTIFGERK